MPIKMQIGKGPTGLIILVGIAIASFVTISALLMIGAFNPQPHANQINSELSKKLGLSGSAGISRSQRTELETANVGLWHVSDHGDVSKRGPLPVSTRTLGFMPQA